MRINSISHSISSNVFFKASGNKTVSVSVPVVSQQVYNISDVFTYEREDKNFFTNTVIKGKNFGEQYELLIDRHNQGSIKGNIGDKQVDVKIERKGEFSNHWWSINGYVGDKKVEMERKTNHLTGQFANEDVDIHTNIISAPGLLVDGKGIKLTKEMGYGTNFLNPKKEIIYGKYSMDKDFLPIIVGITTFLS